MIFYDANNVAVSIGGLHLDATGALVATVQAESDDAVRTLDSFECVASIVLYRGAARRLRRYYRRYCVPYAKGKRLPKPRGRRAKTMQRELWARHIGGGS